MPIVRPDYGEPKSSVLSMHYTKGRHPDSAPRTSGVPCAHRARWAALAFCGLAVAGAEVAEAQIAPGGMTPGMGSPQSNEDKKEGVAEAAPKTPGLLPTTPALPAPKGRRKRWKLLELDGYYRMRTDWLRTLTIGFPDLDPHFRGSA